MWGIWIQVSLSHILNELGNYGRFLSKKIQLRANAHQDLALCQVPVIRHWTDMSSSEADSLGSEIFTAVHQKCNCYLYMMEWGRIEKWWLVRKVLTNSNERQWRPEYREIALGVEGETYSRNTAELKRGLSYWLNWKSDPQTKLEGEWTVRWTCWFEVFVGYLCGDFQLTTRIQAQTLRSIREKN